MAVTDSAAQHRPVRLAVVGGHRGSSFTRSLQRLRGRAELVAVCDTEPAVLKTWADTHPGIRCFADFDQLLADPDVDAVVIATPMNQHASQSIEALAAGKHVLCEVLAATTIEECYRLVEAVEASPRTYMMAENCCYLRSVQIVEKLAAAGRFGRISHLAGGYLHDVRELLHHADGSLSWRGELKAEIANVGYTTHALGPLMHWLRAANGPDDQPATVTAATSHAAATANHFAARFGTDHPMARDDAWARGDTGTVLITTTGGTVITVRVDPASPRPHGRQTTQHELQGSTGAFLGPRRDGEDPLVWLEDPARIGAPAEGDTWESLWDYAELYEGEHWRRWFGHQDNEEGHGGGDFLILERFIAAVDGEIDPPVDVYAAATWSCIAELSAQSIAQGGAAVSFPEFRTERKLQDRPTTGGTNRRVSGVGPVR